MAYTYTQIHTQTMFSVKNRDCIIRESRKDELTIPYPTVLIESWNKYLSASCFATYIL